VDVTGIILPVGFRLPVYVGEAVPVGLIKASPFKLGLSGSLAGIT